MDNLNNVMIFVAADGDGIGNKVARASLADDVEGLHTVSSHIEAGNELIKEFAISRGGQVISSGGDEALVRLPLEHVDELEGLRTDYSYVVGATLTLGVGESLSQASKALMVAKISGKNQILQYSPEVEQKWAQASQDANAGTATGEAKKIGDAYMKNDPQVSQEGQLNPEDANNSPNQDVSDEQVNADAPVDPNITGADAAIDDHSDCPYCAEEDAAQELGEDDCPYCAEDTQIEQEAGLDDCPYCQETHPQEQHQHGDDCAHCQELDNAKAQEGAPQAEQDAGQIAPEAVSEEAAPLPADSPGNASPNELQTNEHQTPDEVLGEFDAAHGEDPSQVGASDTDQIGDVGIAEGGTGQQENISRPDDFNDEIQDGVEDGSNSDQPNYGEVLQDGLNQNADEIQKQKVGDMVRQALQSFKASKNYLEQAQSQSPEFYQANIAMIRGMIEMAKLLGFNGPAQGAPQGQPELGQQQEQMLAEQPDPANPFPTHPENGGAAVEDVPEEQASGGHDWNNPFPAHPENSGDDAGKPRGQ